MVENKKIDKEDYVIKKTSKLINLISLLEGKYAQYSREDIERLLEIKKSTFYNYRKCLEDAGISIDYDKRLKAYKIRGDCYLKPLKLSLSEVLALIASSDSILNNSGLPYYNEINTALAKITATLPKDLQGVLESLQSRVHFSLNSFVDYGGFREIHNLLEGAIAESSNVWMRYCNNKEEISERVLSPYLLNFKNGFLYLIAYCHLKKETRMFRVDSIKECRVTEDKFIYPEDFSLQKYMGNAWGVMRGGDDVDVKVKFTGNIAGWMKKNTYHLTKEVEELEDGSVIMSFVTSGVSEIKGWILKYGASAEVLEPEILREDIKREIREMMEVY